MINSFVFWVAVSLIASVVLWFVAWSADKLMGLMADHFDEADP